MQTTLSECREPGEGRERLGASCEGRSVTVAAAAGCCRGEFNGEKSAPARSRERAISLAVLSASEERELYRPLSSVKMESRSELESTAAARKRNTNSEEEERGGSKKAGEVVGRQGGIRRRVFFVPFIFFLSSKELKFIFLFLSLSRASTPGIMRASSSAC